ncbi:type I restriction-modification system subunit M [Flaviaesturariibacter aridisoli]|uniref:site-specific DNA-methyltransferase (adenine-specific) n=1 Tax=Flaviaesturariibacter aridisoli TaxID=2545761 RepID=A0A4R4DWL1_9BACT|nr:type I restriction-modification system subunit M [Flaviaesturariibacter aridisoli]TCZ65183.1 type I restriction-modification system subunit M [Flaviaesturariibacter aridisoli]
MAIKKSELYSSLWASCDELRGGMDASQYKDYVLTMLFVKYVSDKYSHKANSLIEVPDGATFEDMVALKGRTDIGEQINKKILKPLFSANGLEGAIELVDFDDDNKLGSDKEKVDRLTRLIAIFENPALDFKNNRAEDDDILGDAYEYLMRQFSTQSGKSKGQFYTPAEVSRILAKVIDVHRADKPSYTVYDPTCGSGSLLLKVAEESQRGLTIYGQEMDIATKGLAVMNMWLHGNPEARIYGKNTLAQPQTKDEQGRLMRFDFVVANPPFSTKSWSNGISPMNDEFNRFREYGIPPEKNGDYAFMLHIIASLNSKGKGAVILPHGVLFRGGAEGDIRRNIIQRKLIKGIIGLPANLFYGTGIPACVIVLDKEHADTRKGIFMIDASKGFLKDGNKNRLREQDIHLIVDVFNNQKEVARLSRFVPFAEIEKNEYNLNIPRYIDTQEEEDIQDLDAHLNGGIPNRDVEGLNPYWTVYPNLKTTLFEPLRKGYSCLKVGNMAVKETIYSHPEFKAYSQQLDTVFEGWRTLVTPTLQGINGNTQPKKLIHDISEKLLNSYEGKALVDRYDIYQHLMNYWNEVMKDDVYMLVEDGWVARTRRVVEKNAKGKEIVKGWTCDLLPKSIIVNEYFADRQEAIQQLEAELEATEVEITSLEEEHAGEEGLLADAANDKGRLTKATVSSRLKEIKGDPSEKEAYTLLQTAEKLFDKAGSLSKQLKAQAAELDELAFRQYEKLTEADVKQLVIEAKWMTTLRTHIQGELDAISQRLTARIKELGERYDETLGDLDAAAKELEEKVNDHLQKMGLVWS